MVGDTRVPKTVSVVMLLLLAAAGVMLFVGAWSVGVTWDEKTHVLMLDTFFKQGWNVSPDALLNGVPDPAYIWGVYVYGPVGELVAHAVTAGMGLEPWGEPSYEAAAYAGRHVGVALMAVLGVVAAGLTVLLVTRSRAFAVLGAALLAATPLWVGHGMFNIKDIPVATGYTVGTLGIVALCREDFRTSRRLKSLGLFSLVAGAVLAAGTRAAMGVPVVAGLVVALVALWLQKGRDSRSWALASRDVLVRLGYGLGALVVAYLLLSLIYPKAFINPVELAWQALVVSARFPFDEAVLTAGTWVEQPPPWTYLPRWFIAQLPLLLLFGCTVFVGCWVVMLIRRVLRLPARMDCQQLAMGAAVVTQLLMMPAIAVTLQSNMYNGSRQFLFVVPAAAILAALGIWLITGWLQEPLGRPPWVIRGWWALVTVGIAVPLVSQAFLTPYNYVFLNSVTALQPIEGHWPTDYWRASSREIIQRLPLDGVESCGYEQGRSRELHPCSDEPMFAPYLAERGTAALPGGLGEGEYWLVRENQGDITLPPGCRPHDEITRSLWGHDVVIASIVACPRP